MKVRFRNDILNAPAAYRALDRIVYHFGTGRHVWDIDDDSRIRASGWLAENSYTMRGNIEVLEKALVRSSAYENPSGLMHELVVYVGCAASSKAEHELSPEDACSCLSSPVHVVVENAESDGAFLEAMICAYGRRALLDAHTEQWWQADHLGGFGEVEKRLNDILARTVGPRRVLVIADSDRKYSTELTATQQKITRSCQQLNVAFVILQKRAIENYIPSDALRTLPRTHKARVTCFERLSRDQRDFYDMKWGFRKVNGQATIPAEQATLFACVPPKRLMTLCGGFGDKVHNLFETARGQITAAAMTSLCGSPPNEITRMLDEIERLL